MPDIRISKQHAQLVKNLKSSDEFNGPFETFADALVFAACMAANKKIKKTLVEIAKDPYPIGYDVFVNRGYNEVINLIALHDVGSPTILADDLDTQTARAKVFEEYAEAGLEMLADVLEGSTDYTQRILLLLNSENRDSESEPDLESLLGLSSFTG